MADRKGDGIAGTIIVWAVVALVVTLTVALGVAALRWALGLS